MNSRFTTTFSALALWAASLVNAATPAEISRWQREAREITIIRDDWGVAHVYGKTDANAVFGSEFAQAEDDFNRIETNYLNAMGRLAEAEGESKLYQDLRMKLFINPEALKAQYAASPAWLRKLMDAFADGLNYYLYKHPETHPKVISHFEPWMALSFTEGSIGGDIERVNLNQLQAFYGKTPMKEPASLGDQEDRGSNGMAIAPSNTANKHALLLINPHTSFFFRSELQMVSGEGLNAYGASTWGQFFIYQGFNDHAGWMHTTSGVDAVDEYLETISQKDGKAYYKFGSEERLVISREIVVPYKTPGGLAEKRFTAYWTQHGPIVRELNGKWVAIRMMQEPIKALEQSFLRTKARDYKSYKQTMELKANSSNNTIFADAGGDIAYFHGNYIPRRDTAFDWTKPVDGSNPATEYKGLLDVDEAPNLLNPASGWLYNSNNWPWSAAGASSLKKENYPAYVESGGESARGLHAIRVLEGKKDFTLDSLIAAAFDTYLTWFDKPLPELIAAWDAVPPSNLYKARLTEPVALLKQWDHRWSISSIPTTLAIFWGQEMRRKPGGDPLQVMDAALTRLETDFGTWKMPWGEINRYQRINGDIVQPFSDAAPSIPVGFPYGIWGSLASFSARPYPGTKKWYGTSGNSFVAVVEFGDKVHAKAVTAGGESGHPDSRHFNDQATRYATGDLREVYFYREQLKGHTEREYHP